MGSSFHLAVLPELTTLSKSNSSLSQAPFSYYTLREATAFSVAVICTFLAVFQSKCAPGLSQIVSQTELKEKTQPGLRATGVRGKQDPVTPAPDPLPRGAGSTAEDSAVCLQPVRRRQEGQITHVI